MSSRAALQRWFERAAGALHLARKRPLSALDETVMRWHAANGDATLRLEYDLGPASMVFDVGGYEGDWAAEIATRYGSTVHVFEPVPQFAASIRSRLAGNSNVHVHDFGLSGATREEQMAVDANRSSVFTGGASASTIRLVDIADFLATNRIKAIDLIKINIEGGEYELLDRLIRSGFVSKVHDIQVQFHDFVPDAERRMRAIQEALANTHRLTYQFPFVWENWRRNPG